MFCASHVASEAHRPHREQLKVLHLTISVRRSHALVLQDIEKLGTKEGIVTQSIPEVLQVNQQHENLYVLPRTTISTGLQRQCIHMGHAVKLACERLLNLKLAGLSTSNLISPASSFDRCTILQMLPVQSLCDDDMVHKEKIGASNYFW